MQRNPDVTTIWAYSALLDPDSEDTQADHVVGLPLDNTLHHLKPDEHAQEAGIELDEHPLTQLPKLWKSLNSTTSYALLTTLTLDGVNDIVNDTTLLHLRYCTHLTLLWTRGCKITDLGVRLLASALDLPGRKGLCRLRGWFMPGCTDVSDRSMRSLARWPGLCALDVRGTSVTEAGMTIFNRFSRMYFGGENADMQAVTPGLLGLFVDGAGAAEVLESLCLTLLAGDAPLSAEVDPAGENDTDGRDRWWLALHVQPTSQPFDPAWLPHQPIETPQPIASTNGGVYRPGIGMVYGKGASSIGDTVTTFRDNLKMALQIQGEEDGLADRNLTVYRWDPGETRKQYKARVEKHERAIARQHVKNAKAKARADLAAAQEEEERERSKAFVAPKKGAGERRRGRKVADQKVDSQDGERRGPVQGKRELMLVRMVAPNWEELRWAKAAAEVNSAANTSQVRTAHTSTHVDLVADIIGTQRARATTFSSSPPTGGSSSPFTTRNVRKRPLSPTQSCSTNGVKLEATATPSRPSSNPFKRNATTIPNGIRPLSQARQSSTQIPRSTPSAARPSHTSGGAGKKLEDDFDFGVGTKRRFEGKTDGDGSRRGMKMFSGKRS